ncbi:hypothetical protein LPJ73_005987, partial [Coemansia sp. RSA 2703]
RRRHACGGHPARWTTRAWAAKSPKCAASSASSARSASPTRTRATARAPATATTMAMTTTMMIRLMRTSTCPLRAGGARSTRLQPRKSAKAILFV